MKRIISAILLMSSSIVFYQCSDNAPKPSTQLILTFPNGKEQIIPLTSVGVMDRPDWDASIGASGGNNCSVSMYYSASNDFQAYSGDVRGSRGWLTIEYNDTLWSAISGNINVTYKAQFFNNPEAASLTLSNVVFGSTTATSSMPSSTSSRIVVSGYMYGTK